MRANTLFAVSFVMVGVSLVLSATTLTLTGESALTVAVLAVPVCLSPVAAWVVYQSDDPQTGLTQWVHRATGVVVVVLSVGVVLFGLGTLRAAL